MEKKRYKAIDLFAGIGGIRLGFERAFGDAIETALVCEWDVHAQKTYRANFGEETRIAGDITKLALSDVPEFDICLAGFPCVAFSMAGKRAGFADLYHGQKRGTLFMEIVRICEARRPKVIFCENVKNLVTHDRGNTFRVICDAFEALGYNLYWSILNSKDFGLAQNRERIYIVCFRKDIDKGTFLFPNPTGGGKVIRDILEDAPIPSKYYLSEKALEGLRRHRRKHEALGHGFGYEIRRLDAVAGTIVCGGMGRERNLLIDHREHSMVPMTHITGRINREDVRKMTPREWARLQGFPDEFKLVLSDTHLYKQFGNSVSVTVIEAIAQKIRGCLA